MNSTSSHKIKKIAKICGCILLTPILLFVVLVLLIYLPPVQRFATNIATEKISKSTGLDVSIENLRLRFPLNFDLNGLVAADHNDTLLNAKTVKLDLEFFPLFKGQANVHGIELLVSKIDTRDFVGNTRIYGNVGKLSAELEGVNWKTEKVIVPIAKLTDARLAVVQTDTVLDDRESSKSHWDIYVDEAHIANSKVKLALESLPQQLPAPKNTTWIAANIEQAKLLKGHFDTGNGNYSFQHFDLEKSDVAYNTKGEAGTWNKKPSVLPISEDKRNDSINQWRNQLEFADNMPALWTWNPFIEYGENEVFDADNIVLTDVNVSLDSLSYTNDGVLRTELKHASFKEKSGISVDDATGSIYMDNDRISIPNLSLRTGDTNLDLSLDVPFSALSSGTFPSNNLNLNIDTELSPADVKRLGKSFLPKDILKNYPNQKLKVEGSIGGNLDHLHISALQMNMPGVFSSNISGTLDGIEGNNPSGNIAFDLNTGNQFNSTLMRFVPDIKNTAKIPANTHAKGTLAFSNSNYKINTRITERGGTLNLIANTNLDNETYTADLVANSFPVGDFLIGTDAGRLTANANASGKSYDVMSAKANLKANADIAQFKLSGLDLNNTNLSAQLHNQIAFVDFAAQNSLVKGSGQLSAVLGNDWDGTLKGNFEEINLKQLGVTDESIVAGGNINTKFKARSDFSSFDIDGNVGDIYFVSNDRGFTSQDVRFNLGSARDTTYINMSSGDLVLNASTKGDVSRLLSRLEQLGKMASDQLSAGTLDYQALKRELPLADIHLEAAQRNPFYQFIRLQGYNYKKAFLDLHMHPENGLSGQMEVDSLIASGLLFDLVNLEIEQDTTGILLNGLVKNDSPKNKNKFNAQVSGALQPQAARLGARFFDAEGIEGLNLGLSAEFLKDKGINLSLYPPHPILAYRNFTINADNYIFLGKNKEIKADVNLLADDGTGLKIYSLGSDSVNDITLSVNNINLGELSAVVPYIPEMKGLLSGDVHIFDNHQNLSAMGTLQINDFIYEGTPLGQIGADVTYLPQDADTHWAAANISTGENEVMSFEGTYYNQDGTITANGNMHDFPMALLNGFMEGTDVAFKGTAGGDFTLTGTLSNPLLNGHMNMGDSHVYSNVYGFDFQLDSLLVPINNSVLQFNNYKLYTKGNNPLQINGTVNASNLSSIGLDLVMNAKNFDLINSQKSSQSLLFGKMYADFVGTLKGTVDKMSIRGKLDVLENTNVTYILKDSPLTIDNRLEDIVEFVDFNNPEEKEEEEIVSESTIDMVLGITIDPAARFNCYISEDGKSYLDMQGGGDLTFRLTEQGDMRLTGKLTLEEGKMNYELPIIPLRTFTLAQGSTIEFTGEPANPTLNLSATERVKATVSSDDSQRSVAFDVGVRVTKPLDQMGLEFTIDAPEDMDVKNQLASMSQEQRTQVAVALMATGMYITDNSSMTSGFKASNALNAFLQSEIQNIAGNALKTIDINFGVESGTSRTGTQTTDYSFQFAKRFWNDRISVIIGGRVSSGEDADNHAESIINNVSVEYRINKGASRYVRVFYDRDQQDPLEGLLTKTGVGYSVRRKANSFGDLFIFWKKKE